MTSYLGGYLKETYDLPDHRGDAEYDSWDKCLRKYHEQIDVLTAKLK